VHRPGQPLVAVRRECVVCEVSGSFTIAWQGAQIELLAEQCSQRSPERGRTRLAGPEVRPQVPRREAALCLPNVARTRLALVGQTQGPLGRLPGPDCVQPRSRRHVPDGRVHVVPRAHQRVRAGPHSQLES
jgi:hypothetical protein